MKQVFSSRSLPLLVILVSVMQSLSASPAFRDGAAVPLCDPAPLSGDTASGRPLRILSWNIYMLPRFVHITGKRTRARVIAEQLKTSEYQVLVFQEAFLSDARRIIRSLLKDIFPHEYGPANHAGGFKTNSGIWILSKIPLRQLEELKFCKCYGVADCFARKGALLLEGEYEGQMFQVLGTHLQAAGPQSTRQAQYQEMRALLDRHQRPGVPQIVCGDMNTAKSEATHYCDMLQCLAVEDGPLDVQIEGASNFYPNDLRTWGNDRFDVIDYVFYRHNSKPAKKITRVLRSIRKPWDKNHQDLSDHFAVDFAIWW
jgi:endonuclease/exonuclease/phosphatase family metal-dependent hydrolase